MIKINGILESDTDQELTSVLNDLSVYFDYKDIIIVDGEEVSNPESKANFSIRKATEFLVDSANLQRYREADLEARDNVVRVRIDNSLIV